MLLMQLPQRDTEENYVTLYLRGLKEEVKKAVSLNSENLSSLLSLKSAALRYDQVIQPPTQRWTSNALTAQEKEDDDASSYAARGGGRGDGGGRGGGCSGGGGNRGDWVKTSVKCAGCLQTGHVLRNCPTIQENWKKIHEEKAGATTKKTDGKDDKDDEYAQTAFALTAWLPDAVPENRHPQADACARVRRVGEKKDVSKVVGESADEKRNGKKKSELVETSPTDAAGRKCDRRNRKRNGNRSNSSNRNCERRANRIRTSDKFFDAETVGTAEYAAVATVDEENEKNEFVTELLKSGANPTSAKTGKPTISQIEVNNESARKKKLTNDDLQKMNQAEYDEYIAKEARRLGWTVKLLPTTKLTKHRSELGVLTANGNDSVPPTPQDPKLATLTLNKSRIDAEGTAENCENLRESQRVRKQRKELGIVGNLKETSVESGDSGFDRH
ncbi:hypothetical protein HK104_001619 [Borealophlyctis nickersoniae]|nr:hypothetical protein HK104_001619 [Borealophlyctis nickersoniae]